MHKKVEVGKIKGNSYSLVFDKYKNQQACDDAIAHKWAWFLSINNDYEGTFKTKREAVNLLTSFKG